MLTAYQLFLLCLALSFLKAYLVAFSLLYLSSIFYTYKCRFPKREIAMDKTGNRYGQNGKRKGPRLPETGKNKYL